MRADRERDLRRLAPPYISAHGKVDGDLRLELPAFFSLDLDFLTFGGGALTCSFKQTLCLFLVTYSDLLTIVAEVHYPGTSCRLTSLKINSDEVTVGGVTL